MAQDSKIQWTEHTWNPVSGCTKISSGCKNCYAETIANRFWKDRKFTDVQTHSHKLIEPIKRKKPTTYFVNSMSDLFHEDVPFDFIDQVFAVMASTPQHTYQVLTKRPERMLEYLSIDRRMQWAEWSAHLAGGNDPDPLFDSIHYGDEVLPNVWLGVSVENQEQADKRHSYLMATPAAIHFWSAEPLIGPIECVPLWAKCGKPSWVIIGGESGPKARPCHIDWIRSLVKQCKEAGVAYFVKQLGSNFRSVNPESESVCPPLVRWQFRDPKGGDITEWPSDLQVRQFPNP